MAFLRLGSYILEVVEREGDPARFWGLVVVVPDPGAVPGAGPAKNAVQPGRRIATVKGLGHRARGDVAARVELLRQAAGRVPRLALG